MINKLGFTKAALKLSEKEMRILQKLQRNNKKALKRIEASKKEKEAKNAIEMLQDYFMQKGYVPKA